MNKIVDAEYEEIDTVQKETGDSERKEKVEFTEEEAKIAAENVKKMLETLNKYKPLNERRVDKMKKLKEEHDSLPEGHYKRKQIQFKIYDLGKKVNRNIIPMPETKNEEKGDK